MVVAAARGCSHTAAAALQSVGSRPPSSQHLSSAVRGRQAVRGEEPVLVRGSAVTRPHNNLRRSHLFSELETRYLVNP